jgi:hypothetical protein
MPQADLGEIIASSMAADIGSMSRQPEYLSRNISAVPNGPENATVGASLDFHGKEFA